MDRYRWLRCKKKPWLNHVSRNNELLLTGFFSAKLRKHQITWLPCEIEAVSIAAAVKHFNPYIIQSKLNVRVLTDSKPCVQATDKLARGEFSASPRVTSFSDQQLTDTK